MGSIVFLVEIAPPDKTGLYGAVSLWSATIGTMLGSVVAYVVRASMSRDASPPPPHPFQYSTTHQRLHVTH